MSILHSALPVHLIFISRTGTAWLDRNHPLQHQPEITTGSLRPHWTGANDWRIRQSFVPALVTPPAIPWKCAQPLPEEEPSLFRPLSLLPILRRNLTPPQYLAITRWKVRHSRGVS